MTKKAKKASPRYRHFAGIKTLRTNKTPTGTGWTSEDNRFTYYQDPDATSVCTNPHPVGNHTGAKCPGGREHLINWWYVLETATGERAFGYGGAECLTDVVLAVQRYLKREEERSA